MNWIRLNEIGVGSVCLLWVVAFRLIVTEVPVSIGDGLQAFLYGLTMSAGCRLMWSSVVVKKLPSPFHEIQDPYYVFMGGIALVWVSADAMLRLI